jgi:hypothetical protein
MKRKLFGLLIKLMYRNLSKGDYGCSHCKENTESIIKLLESRKRVVIAFNPDFNVIHDEDRLHGHPVNSVHQVFMSYHISDVTLKYPHPATN